MAQVETVRRLAGAARARLAAAGRNLAAGACRDAIDEAYYAALQAASAALAARDLEYDEEPAVVADFERVFVDEESLFEAEVARRLEELSEYRMRYDSEPLDDEEATAEYAYAAAEVFLGEVLGYVDRWLERARDKKR
jgi:uncharacterized protein (UPF0332 family)